MYIILSLDYIAIQGLVDRFRMRSSRSSTRIHVSVCVRIV
jgi:hypothetical protein